MKLVFTPFSIAASMVAGLAASKIFEFIWSKIDEEEAPDPKHREIDWRKMAAALVIEGAIFRLVRGAADHGMRTAFARSIGSWPGEEAPEQKA